MNFEKESLSKCNHTADGSIGDSPLALVILGTLFFLRATATFTLRHGAGCSTKDMDTSYMQLKIMLGKKFK